MSNDTNELLLVWQNPKTRLRYTVGKLWRGNGKYYFSYDKENIISAYENGYQLHPGFPEVERIYDSNTLFPVFARRLPNKERNDFENILKKYQLTKDSSDFEVLVATGGRLATDDYEFVPVLNECSNVKLEHTFYLAGWKYYNGPNLLQDELSQGTPLEIVPEPENIYDRYALKVYTKNGIKIGYVPIFYTKQIGYYLEKGCNIIATVIDFKPENESNFVLQIRIVCDKKCKEPR